MNYKKIVGEYFIIIFLMIILLFFWSFISFNIFSKAVSPEVVIFDVSQDFSFDSINEDGLYSEVTLEGTGDNSFEHSQVPPEEAEIGVIRSVSAYNVGDIYQTDSTPCVGAMGTNICEKLERGEKICAANFVKLGTIINIEGYGNCVVEDRMAKKNEQKVDIAMQLHQKEEALAFGRKNLKVKIIK